MNRLFRLLAPTGRKQAIAVGFTLVGLIALSNIVFFYFYEGALLRPMSFYFWQAFFVGGPFVTFVMVTTRYQVKLQKRLSLLSRKDGLTGLNNRRTFLELAQLRLDESPHGVIILLDADHFKRVNDVYGHSVGDVCLKEIAHRLKWNLREIDVAGRIGGEEFAVLFANATIEQARVIAGRLGQPIPFRADGVEAHLSITLSMGAVLIEPEISLDAHLIRADQALYAAKEAGRARLVIWSEPQPATSEDGSKKSAA